MRAMASSPVRKTLTPSSRSVTSDGHFAAVVLAAGFSSRMGAFKPLLPLAGRTALERCVSLFRDADIRDVRVVVGHRRESLEPKLRSMNVRMIVNEHPEQGMFSSIRAALVDLIQVRCHDQGRLPAGVLFLPVDIPALRPATISRLLQSWLSTEPRPLTLVPCFLGRAGHPAVFARRAFEDVLAWSGAEGLRGWMAQHPPHGPECVDVADAGILLDMDDPTDVHVLEKRLERTLDLSVPDAEECLALHQCYDPDPSRRRIRAHCLATARSALRLGAAMLQAGCKVSLELLASAALLHDVAKGAAGHAKTGAVFLRAQGFPEISAMVAAHHILDMPRSLDVDETALLRLADLLTVEDRGVSLKKRFALTAQRHAGDAQALIAIPGKYQAACRLHRLVKERTGRCPETTVLHPWAGEQELLRGFTP